MGAFTSQPNRRLSIANSKQDPKQTIQTPEYHPLLSYQYRLLIKSVTWQRDSHGLFDYEGKDTNRKQLKAHGGSCNF